MRCALLLLLALLTGCASYRAQPIAPARLARQFEARSLGDPGLRAYLSRALGRGAPLPARWNQAMLTLAAWYFSPAMDVARAQWKTAQAGIEVADAIPNPVLQFPFQISSPNPGPGSPFTWGPALDITIETAGKRGYRTDQASHLAESARLHIADQAWKVRAQVRDAMLAVYAARERGKYLAGKAGALQDIVRMVEKRRAVGESSGPDVDAALLAATQAQSDLAAARAAQSDARAKLAAAIGVPPRALAGVQLDLDAFGAAPAAPPDAAAQDAAVFHRADLLASLSDYAAAESALQLEVAKQYPDIHLGPGYTYDTGTRKISFGLAALALPIFDRNQGGIARAEARRKEAAARTAALQDSILGDLDRNLEHYRASVAAIDIADRRLAAARRQFDNQAADFAAGNADRLAYTQAKADFAASQIMELDALIAARQAGGLLEDTLQRPLAEGALPLINASSIEQEPRK